MADSHYFAGAQEASAPQIPQQFDQLQQPLQQGYQEPQQDVRYDPQSMPKEQVNYQPNGYVQDYPQSQVENWQNDRPLAPLEQQILPQQPEGTRFVSNQQPQTEFQYEPSSQVQDIRPQEYSPNQPEQDIRYGAHQPSHQGQQLHQQQYQQAPREEYQQGSYGQYFTQQQVHQNNRHPVAEPNHEEYWTDPQREFSPIRDVRHGYKPASRFETQPREFDQYDPPPPPREHMRYEPYPEPESDIRYERHQSRYDHEVGETRHPRQQGQNGYRNFSPEPQMDRSYLRAADRFPRKEYRSRYDNVVENTKDLVTRNESIPKNEPSRAERSRPGRAREEYRTRPLRYAYTSPKRNRSRDELPIPVPGFESYRPAETPARHRYASPEKDRFRFDEMTRALPRGDLKKQPKNSDKVALRRNVSSTEKYIAPDYGYKRSSKQADYPREPRRRQVSPPFPPPKPRHSQRQSLQEPPSPRENFQRSRRSRDFY